MTTSASEGQPDAPNRRSQLKSDRRLQLLSAAERLFAERGFLAVRLEDIGAVLSMSRAGHPWENGKCESFMATLKREQIDARPYTSLEELERDIQEFIDQTYNRVRLHSALTYLSPEQFEARQAQAKTTPPWLPAVLSLSRHEEVSPVPAPLSGGQP